MAIRLRKLIAAAAATALFLASAPASAQALHYFTQDNYLFSFNDLTNVRSSVELTIGGGSFTTTEGRFAGLAFDPNGTLWGSTGTGRFYTINTVTGEVTHKFTPGITIPTFDFRQNGGTLEILATATQPGGASSLRRYDASTGAQIGTSVNISVSQNNAGNPASGYDPLADTFYVVRGGAASNSVSDFTVRAYDAASLAPLAGPAGDPKQTGLTWSSAAGAWFAGELYFGYRPGVDAGLGNWNLPAGSSTVNFGRINTATGAFTLDFQFNDLGVGAFPFPLSTGVATGPSFGYAVMMNPVPEPGTYAMMIAGLLMLGAISRKKSA